MYSIIVLKVAQCTYLLLTEHETAKPEQALPHVTLLMQMTTIRVLNFKYKIRTVVETFVYFHFLLSVAKPDEPDLRSHCCGKIIFQSWWK